MPREPDPINDSELYDSITLGGVTSGQWVRKITGHDRKVNWDVKTAQGQKGASTELKDMPPTAFKVEFFLTSEIDFAAWPAFRELIFSTISATKPKALDIYHPDLEVNGFKSVVLANFGGVVHDGKGGQTITVEFQEYSPPKPKSGSPNGSKAKKADPNAAANAELAALTETYKNTPWG